MSIIAIVNRKGGSGKSTLATHVAAWLAHQREQVMLGDVDRQHTCTQWLARRRGLGPSVPALAGWAVDPQRVLRPPAGTTHVVLDTPGGLHGYELTRLLGHADVVLVPVCDAPFDLDAAAECLAELRAHPRVAGGRTLLAVVGMRCELRGRSLQRLRDWAAEQSVAWLGVIPSAPLYPFCAARGLTVFDLPADRASAMLKHWTPALRQLDALLLKQRAAARPRTARPIDGPGRGIIAPLATTRPIALAPDAPALPQLDDPRPAAMAGWWDWLGGLWSTGSRRHPLHR